MNRRALFAAYNSMKKMARDGYFDMDRVNRALGLAQRKEKRPYDTSIEYCDCMDKRTRRHMGVTCKHQLALLLKEMAKWPPA